MSFMLKKATSNIKKPPKIIMTPLIMQKYASVQGIENKLIIRLISIKERTFKIASLYIRKY